MDTLIQERVSQKANELTATYDEKIMNYEDRYHRFSYHCQIHSTSSSLSESRTCSDSFPSPKTNFEIYVFRTRPTKLSSLIIVRSKVNQVSWIIASAVYFVTNRSRSCLETGRNGYDHSRPGSCQQPYCCT